MKYFYITASELAKLTGHNQYESKQNTIRSLLKKFGIKDVYVPKSNTEEGLNKLSPAQLELLKKELSKLTGLNQSHSSIYLLEGVIKKYIILPTQQENLDEEQSRELFTTLVTNGGILEHISGYIKKDLRMRRGNVREKKNLDKLQTTSNIVIKERNSKMYTKELIRTDNYCIILRGKVDGISGDTVVEAKNRCNRLFMELRDYERVQLECYMYLTGYNKAILTEHYNETSNQISYNHDSCFWEECVRLSVEFIDVNIVPHIVD
jgi:hypothetical protein